MNADRETTRIVRSWLEDGVTRLPDPILDAVLDELPSTRQRRASWWPLRLPQTNMAFTFGIAAAAVVIAALLGVRLLLPDGSGDGSPGDQPSPTPATSSSAWPDSAGNIAAGTYLSDSPSPVRTTITVPEGWFACEVGTAVLVACSDAGHRGEISVSLVENVVADPCDRGRALLEPPVGESVDDLVGALSSLSGFAAGDPFDISLDGYVGKEFELTAPTDPECVLDEAGLGTWTFPSRTLGVNGVGPGEVNLLRIIDVEGVRVMIAAAYQSIASAAQITQIREIFESVRVAP